MTLIIFAKSFLLCILGGIVSPPNPQILVHREPQKVALFEKGFFADMIVKVRSHWVRVALLPPTVS